LPDDLFMKMFLIQLCAQNVLGALTSRSPKFFGEIERILAGIESQIMIYIGKYLTRDNPKLWHAALGAELINLHLKNRESLYLIESNIISFDRRFKLFLSSLL